MSCPKGYYCFKERLFIIFLCGLAIVFYICYNFLQKNNEIVQNSLKNTEQIHNKINDTNIHTQRIVNEQLSNLNHQRVISSRNDLFLDRIRNPLVPPEETYMGRRGIPINTKTRGEPNTFQQVGYMYSDSGDKQLPIYGRQTYPGSNKWNYYTANDQYNSIKMPITKDKQDCMRNEGCVQINDGDTGIKLEDGNSSKNYTVKKYEYSSPKYIPF